MVNAERLARQSGVYDTRCAVIEPSYSLANAGDAVATWTLRGWRHLELRPTQGAENRIGAAVLLESEFVARLPWENGIRANMRILIPLPKLTLAGGGVSDSATAWTLAAAGVQPELRAGFYYARCESEIVKVTAGHNTTALTVARAQLGTSAAAHAAGVLIFPLREMAITGLVDAENARAEWLIGLNGVQA